jgi:PIN domain nuclease of toxin-antitoxin system
MKLLLDTHVFLWYVSGDPQLPIPLRDVIRDPATDVTVSVVAIWESVIKFALGKLPLPAPPAAYLTGLRVQHNFATLPIDEGSMSFLAGLSKHHKDPFDRMLVAQALQHGLTVASLDDDVRAYPVPVLPAR